MTIIFCLGLMFSGHICINMHFTSLFTLILIQYKKIMLEVLKIAYILICQPGMYLLYLWCCISCIDCVYHIISAFPMYDVITHCCVPSLTVWVAVTHRHSLTLSLLAPPLWWASFHSRSDTRLLQCRKHQLMFFNIIAGNEWNCTWHVNFLIQTGHHCLGNLFYILKN